MAELWDTIVVGTDGSDTAKRAVGEATRMARMTGATVHLVCAYEPLRGVRIVGAPEGAARVWEVRSDTEGRAIADAAASQVRGHGVTARAHAMPGDPAAALLDVAEHENADVIVIGSHGMHGVRRVLGSVPNTVSHQARCNVLIVATEDAA